MTVKVLSEFAGNTEVMENVGYVQVRVARVSGGLFYFVEGSSYSSSRNRGRDLCIFMNAVSALDFQDIVNTCYKDGVNTLSFKVRGDQFSYTREIREEELNEERE